MSRLQQADGRYDVWGTYVLTSDSHPLGSPFLEQNPLDRGIDKGPASRAFDDWYHAEWNLKEDNFVKAMLKLGLHIMLLFYY